MTTLTDNYNGGVRQQTWWYKTGGALLNTDPNELTLGAGDGGSAQHYDEYITSPLSTDQHSAQDEMWFTETTGIPFAYTGPAVRVHSSVASYYFGGIVAEDGTIFINKMNAGTFEDGPSSSVTAWEAGVHHTIQLRATGTTTTHLELFIDGVTTGLTWDDSTSPFYGANHLMVGHVGYYNPGTDFHWFYDNFSGTDLAVVGNPANLTVTPSGSTAALAWDASAGAIDYSVFRRTPQTGAAFNPLSDTPLASGVAGLSYNDTGIAAGNYDYQVFGRLT